MDVGCNCFGVATAAKVPVKRYNLLVPAIFPVTEPSVTKPLGIATEKNIKRLSEYLERNEHRIPKVSRRLARRLHSDLGNRKLGYVRVAVATFQELVSASGGQFARIYARELICGYPTKIKHIWSLGRGPAVSRLPPESAHLGSVVGVLLADPIPQAQMWGLDILLDVMKAQDSAEFVTQMEAFVPLLCGKATAAHLNPTTPPSAATDGTGASMVAATSLRALLEHLRLCARISYVSRHLDTITYAVLGIMEADAIVSGATYATAQEALASSNGGGSPRLLSKTSIGARVGASAPGLAALLVYQELGHMTRDAAEGKKVLDFLLRFLDERPGRWEGGPALDLGLVAMREACSQEHQRYLLASTLVCHAGATPGLTPRQRTATLRQAMKDVEALEQGLAAPALLMALQELPAALVAARAAESGSLAAAADPDVAVMEKAILNSVTILAVKLGGRAQLTSVLAAALGRLGPTTPRASATLRCCAAAASAYSKLAAKTPGATLTTHLSNVLLQSTLGVCLQRQPTQRVLAHTILQHALAAVPSGAYPQQVDLVLSSLWHEAALPDNTPACYVAMSRTLDGLMAAAAATPEGQLHACQLVLAVQAEVVNQEEGSSGSPNNRLANATATQQHALLLMCSAEWGLMAQRLSYPALIQARPSGITDLPSLVASGPHGLELGPGAAPNGSCFTADDDKGAAETLAGVVLPPEAAEVVVSAPSFKRLGPIVLNPALSFKAFPLSSIQPNITLGVPSDGVEQQSVQAKRLLAAFATEGGEAQRRASVASPIPPLENGPAALLSVGSKAESDGRGVLVSKKSLRDVLAGVEAALVSPA